VTYRFQKIKYFHHYALQKRLNKSGVKVKGYDLARNAGTLTISSPDYYAGYEYVGQFKNDLPEGQGKATFSAPHSFAGDQYVGNFKEGKKHGKGTYIHANGFVRKGIYKNDFYVGK
jgi:hypothetical protein